MPVYFAYGSNLDRAAMALRCPGAAPLGLASLPGHAFFIMANSYASVRSRQDAVVHGLLWDIPDGEIGALDAYEEVDTGLYRKVIAPVMRADGTAVDAFFYVGETEATGHPTTAYMGGIIDAAAALGLPAGYRRELHAWVP